MQFVQLLVISCAFIYNVQATPLKDEQLQAMFQSMSSLSDIPSLVDHEDATLTIPEVIAKYGYPIEIHSITTEDGYILEAHRIPYGRECGPAEGKRVIWLQHGLMGDSSNWIISGPGKAFGYVLADACYDVWMGNFRGNTYSKKHLTLDPVKDKEAFWGFSWNEIGIYDVPANIDYALAVTGEDSLYYAGHSMGTTSIWVLLSEKPEYNAKIKLMNALAPVSYTEHMVSPMALIAPFVNTVDWLLQMIGLYEFAPSGPFMEFLGATVCRETSPIQAVCSNVLFLIAGYNFNQTDPIVLSIALGHSPAGASTGCIIHYAQGVNSAKFRKYDYGRQENLIKYGQETPPDYDVSKITAPVAFYWGQNDWLTAPSDVYRLAEQLPNIVRFFRVPHDKYNHMDFLWAIDNNELLQDHVIDFMEKHY